MSRISSAERGKNMTIVCCMNAAGSYVPPAMIFPRSRKKPELYRDAPAGTLELISESGYMNSGLFIEWLHHFQSHVRASADNPVLLLIDNHSSHITLEGIEFARKNHISILTLPPHCSHRIQPLDRVFFGPLKNAYAIEVNKWHTMKPGHGLSWADLAGLFRAAYIRVADIQKGEQGFKCTGIYPFNPDVFCEDDFAPASVTEGTLYFNSVVNEMETDLTDRDVLLLFSALESITKEKSTTAQSDSHSAALDSVNDASPSTSSIESRDQSSSLIDTPSVSSSFVATPSVSSSFVATPSVSSSLVATPSVSSVNSRAASDILSPGKIMPLPKREEPVVRRRNKMSSAVITSSPFKEQKENDLKELLKKQKQKEDRKRKKEANAERRKSQRVRKPVKKVNASEDEDVAPVNRMLDFDSDSDDSASCLYCNEPYKNSRSKEMWIQCTELSCRKWAHALCAGVENDAMNFICDICV